jgi:hypothetical protein
MRLEEDLRMLHGVILPMTCVTMEQNPKILKCRPSPVRAVVAASYA